MNTNVTSGSLYNWTQSIYALHAFCLLLGIFGVPTIVGAFSHPLAVDHRAGASPADQSNRARYARSGD